jgi:hypothetical protein
MKILFFTIVLDGLPFLPLIYAELRKLPKEIEWAWWIMEGTAAPQHCTKWVKEIEPRLSRDGTTEFLKSLNDFDYRIRAFSCPQWGGKIEMVNYPLEYIGDDTSDDEEFLLWQMDADELFSAEQIHCMWDMFRTNPQKNAAFFWCRYFVGPDKVITTRNCFGNQSNYEWLRVWKIKPGMLFRTHEPPVIEGLKLNPFTHAETEARGLVFDHFAYATRAQVAFKQEFYAGANNPNARHYKGLVERWEKFQQEKEWPRPLIELFPWVEPHVMVDKL